MSIWCGLDIETTGLLESKDVQPHKLIEIALLLYDSVTHKQVGSFIRRFNPSRPIDAKAQEVHGISFAELAHLPKLEEDLEAISYIQRILSKSELVVAHNGIGFDWPFMQMEFARIGKELPHCPMVDTCLSGRWATAYGKIPNLKELAFATGVSYDPELAHQAEYDTRITMECFFVGLNKGFYTLPASVTAR